MSWAERAADRSPVVQRSRTRGVEQAKAIVAAARRLIDTKGPTFTTQELVKEAGIALQTFYRYFPGKDQLMLAVLEDMVEEGAESYRARARKISDPVARLRFYVHTVLDSLEGTAKGASFVTSEHFRLQTLYPDDVSRATRPFRELVLEDIKKGCEAGELNTPDPVYAAWLMEQLVRSVYHHYDCAGLDEPIQRIRDRVWAFCLAALGGREPATERHPARVRRPRTG
jgi:TetR/AcrR family transcriptional regulator